MECFTNIVNTDQTKNLSKLKLLYIILILIAIPLFVTKQ